jgi:hypothetical protein
LPRAKQDAAQNLAARAELPSSPELVEKPAE